MATATFTAYTGTTLSVYFVGTFQAVDYCQSISVMSDTNADYNDPGAAVVLLRDAATNFIMAYRNDVPLADGTVSFTGLGTLLAGARFDGTNYNIRLGSNTGAEASSTAFDVHRILLMSANTALPTGATNQEFCEGAVWFGDIGDAAMQDDSGECPHLLERDLDGAEPSGLSLRDR